MIFVVSVFLKEVVLRERVCEYSEPLQISQKRVIYSTYKTVQPRSDQCVSVDWASSPQTKPSPVQFPVRTYAWVVGSVPGWGTGEATDRYFPLSPSIPLSLKINKYNL